MRISSKQIESVLSLPAPKRYSHFVKQVADWGKVWGLYDNGWATTSSDSGSIFFPVWPHKEYADLCISGQWANYVAEPIELEDFMNDVLPTLQRDKIGIGVFYTMSHGSVGVEIEILLQDLQNELLKY